MPTNIPNLDLLQFSGISYGQNPCVLCSRSLQCRDETATIAVMKAIEAIPGVKACRRAKRGWPIIIELDQIAFNDPSKRRAVLRAVKDVVGLV